MKPARRQLLSAIFSGSVSQVNQLLHTYEMSEFEKVPYNSKKDLSPVHKAIYHKQLQILELLLKYGANMNFDNDIVHTPLHFVISDPRCSDLSEDYKLKVVNLLLDYGADAEIRGEFGATPLIIAVQKKYVKIIRVLLHYEASTEVSDDLDKSPLSIALDHSSNEIIQMLLERGAKIDIDNDNLCCQLTQFAIRSGNLKLLKNLLDLGHDVSKPLEYSQSLLISAASSGQGEIFKLLLKRGIIVDVKQDNYGLINAALCHMDIFEQLLDLGVEINVNSFKIQEQLFVAARIGHESVVEKLLVRGVDVNSHKRSKCNNALNCAIEEGHERIVNLLLDHGADVNIRHPGVPAALCVAALNGRANIIKLVLDRGASIDEDKTLLSLAAKSGHVKVVELLLKRGAFVDVEGILHAACEENCSDGVVKQLLECGAKIEGLDSDGLTPLLRATFNGHTRAVEVLLDHGANIEAEGTTRNTPLLFAAAKGYADIVRVLLDHGANIEARNAHSCTPLFLAVSRENNQAVIEMLLKHEANVEARNVFNETPLIVAASEGHLRAVDVLLDRGADINVDTPQNDGIICYLERHATSKHRSDSTMCKNIELVTTFLKEEMVRMTFVNLHLNPQNRQRINRGLEVELRHCKNMCELEIEIMQREYVEHTDLSYYDLLRRDVGELTAYGINEHVIRELESNEFGKRFPRWAPTIKKRFKKACERKKLLEVVYLFFYSLCDAEDVLLPELPLGCIDRIVGFLADRDVRCVNNVCKPPVKKTTI